MNNYRNILLFFETGIQIKLLKSLFPIVTEVSGITKNHIQLQEFQ